MRAREARTDWHHYRGWTLVDLHAARYATKGGRYVRVCGLHEDGHTAPEKFREVVDREESHG